MAFQSCSNSKREIPTHPDSPIFKDSAVVVLTRKIEASPQTAKYYYDRGLLLHRMQQDTFAIRDFEQAAKLDSNRAEYFSAVGDLMFEHKDLSGSLSWIQRAVQLNPNDPTARLKIAKLFVFTKEYPKAFSEINIVLRQNAMNSEAYFLKGLIYKDLKDSSKAISSFQTAIQVDPSYTPAMVQLGSIFAKQRNPIALKYFENAFKADTSDVFPLYAKGMYYQEKEMPEDAKNEYRIAIAHNKNYDKAYFAIGFILMQQDSIEQALQQFDKVTGINPTDAKAYYNRGLCQELLGKKAEALLDYKQALNFDRNYAEAEAAIKRLKNKN
ncbi:MAG: tetratricopeptide repeat protein [Bacteroidetes bacterium]|nr:tetratricopeptide repeat protein [Bacteroidota bacterium]MBS1740557.1 tetratricopeptide repeat protein [Bacteroidota bacterium]